MAGIGVDPTNGLEKITLKSPTGDEAELYIHGAHVTSWRTEDKEELLFLSSKAEFKPPKAVRGGIPICFPQFGNMGPLAAQHGFARNSPWTVVSVTPDTALLRLEPSQEQLKLFPHPFKFDVEVTIRDKNLTQILRVENTGESELAFTMALHSYFRITDVNKVHVLGLQGVSYLDSLQDRIKLTEEASSVRFGSEVDRIYLTTPAEVKLVDEVNGRIFTVLKEGLPDLVVWNPWIDKARGMSDFGDEEYKEMVCLEPAIAGSGPVKLPPSHVWKASLILAVHQ